MCIRRETREKARRSLAFSRVSKPHTHITHMLRQCTSIVYICHKSVPNSRRPPKPIIHLLSCQLNIILVYHDLNDKKKLNCQWMVHYHILFCVISTICWQGWRGLDIDGKSNTPVRINRQITDTNIIVWTQTVHKRPLGGP
jgi:hypothetical protein